MNPSGDHFFISPKTTDNGKGLKQFQANLITSQDRKNNNLGYHRRIGSQALQENLD